MRARVHGALGYARYGYERDTAGNRPQEVGGGCGYQPMRASQQDLAVELTDGTVATMGAMRPMRTVELRAYRDTRRSMTSVKGVLLACAIGAAIGVGAMVLFPGRELLTDTVAAGLTGLGIAWLIWWPYRHRQRA